MDGLSTLDAARLLAEQGPNEIAPQPRAASALSWLIRLIADPMVLLLAVAGGTYLVLGDRFDAAVTLGALAPIFFVGAVLEYRSDRALERLRELAAPTARVMRDGVEVAVPATAVVPGDLVVLREGDVIPADGRVRASVRLAVDESALTGESLPTEKTIGASALAGTTVRSGRGTILVDRTGLSTEYGKIAARLAQLRNPQTPIERAIHRIVLQVGGAVLVACAGVIVLSHAHGDPWASAVIAGVSLAMAAIPEEFPMVYTLYLALGAWRLARDRALVRKLGSVEALGAVTVICVDKTGTITYGTLDLRDRVPARGVSARTLDDAIAWSCDPDSGDPLDAAMARALSPNREGLTIVSSIPFDPDRRYSGNVVRTPNGDVTAIKGASDAIFARCGDVPHELNARAEELAFDGARVLALALDDRVVGIIAFADPIRADARDALVSCREAGVRAMMITGDRAETARSIAAQIGLTNDPNRVIEGEALDAMGDLELCDRIGDYDVVARARPEHKLPIVQALHARDAIVAMTGDGTNDALALRAADIGIALGKRGTAVAREAADLVLLDDDFSTIVRAISDGRRIFHNMRHAFAYLTSFHAPLLVSSILMPLLDVPLLLLPVHFVWLELIVHPTSALVFENDPPERDVMTSGPRNARSSLIEPRDWARTLVLGLTLSGAVVATYLMLLRAALPIDQARAAAMIAMLVGQMALVLAERAERRPLWTVPLAGNRSIGPILAGTGIMLAAAIYLPPVAALLHFAPPPPLVVGYAAAAGALAVLWLQPLLALRVARVRA